MLIKLKELLKYALIVIQLKIKRIFFLISDTARTFNESHLNW